jgi:hypothetical protein
LSDAAAGAGSARGGAQATSPGGDPLARIVFAVIVVACFAAFLITQRLKHTPTVVQEFKLTPYFSPYPSGHEKQAEISFKLEHAEDVTVTIINSAGSTVATLVHEYPLASYRTFSLRWNGHRGTARRLQRTLSPRGLPVYTPVNEGALASAGEYRVRVALQHHGPVLSPLSTTLVAP